MHIRRSGSQDALHHLRRPAAERPHATSRPQADALSRCRTRLEHFRQRKRRHSSWPESRQWLGRNVQSLHSSSATPAERSLAKPLIDGRKPHARFGMIPALFLASVSASISRNGSLESTPCPSPAHTVETLNGSSRPHEPLKAGASSISSPD